MDIILSFYLNGRIDNKFQRHGAQNTSKIQA